MKKFFKGFAVFLLSLFLFSCSQGANTIAKKSSITFTLPTLSRSEGRVGDTLDEISQDIIPNEVPVEFEVKAYKISEEIIQAAIEWNNINKDNEKIRIDEPTIASEETDYNDAEIVSVEEEPEENKETDSIQDSLQYYFDCFIGDFSREKSSFEKECLHYFGEKCVKAKGKEGEPVTLRLEEGYYFVSVIGIQKNNEETCFIGFGTGKVDLENENTLKIVARNGEQYGFRYLALADYYTEEIVFEKKDGNIASASIDVSDKRIEADYGSYDQVLDFAENDLILIGFDNFYTNVKVENLNLRLVDENGNLYAELADIDEERDLMAGLNYACFTLKAVKSSPYFDYFNPEYHKYFVEMSYECNDEETLILSPEPFEPETQKYKCDLCGEEYDTQEEADSCYIKDVSKRDYGTVEISNFIENGELKFNYNSNGYYLSAQQMKWEDFEQNTWGSLKLTYNGYSSDNVNKVNFGLAKAKIEGEKITYTPVCISEGQFIKGFNEITLDLLIEEIIEDDLYIIIYYYKEEGYITNPQVYLYTESVPQETTYDINLNELSGLNNVQFVRQYAGDYSYYQPEKLIDITDLFEGSIPEEGDTIQLYFTGKLNSGTVYGLSVKLYGMINGMEWDPALSEMVVLADEISDEGGAFSTTLEFKYGGEAADTADKELIENYKNSTYKKIYIQFYYPTVIADEYMDSAKGKCITENPQAVLIVNSNN